ncbi:hypothetical protein DXG03_000581 [Asterophora parasitica]|uniref:Protein kinase domain-containing protein n=1 Tax=Asterophora parasitica TaxID=117018 RepID=A0A9P7G190_9AGAR|nr:hypothetical protein DXG03_000581 [Asterophora parasitica]
MTCYIVQFCSKGDGNYKVPHKSSEGSFVFVKRGTNLEAEARTQTHFYHQAQKSSGGPRVYDIFEDGYGDTYLVMEYIAARSFEDLIKDTRSEPEKMSLRDTAITKIAGGGKIQHMFFGMEEAPIEFACFRIALSHSPEKPKPRINLTAETRLYSPSDVALKNFLWDGQEVSFVDWQHVSLLPQSFASFYFHATTDRLVQEVANKIDLPRSEELKWIEVAAGTVLQAGIPGYDLDEYGKKRISV